MATNTEQSKVVVDLEISRAQDKLKQLKNEASNLKGELKELEKTKGINTAEYDNALVKLTKINAEAAQLRKQLNNSVDLIIDGKTSDNTLRELDAAARKLRSEIRGTTQSSEELITKMKRLAEIEVQIEQLNKPLVDFKRELREAGQEGSLVQLRSRVSALREELDKLPAKSAEFTAKAREFQLAEKELRRVEVAAKGTGGAFNFLKEQIKQIGPLAAAFFGFQFISQQFTNIINGAGKLSDQLADIAKTTGLSTQAVEQLNREFGKIDTRTATGQLREIAIVAGQLAIPEEDILSFVQSTDKLNVALGDEFGGNAEALATELGKLRNVFGDIKTTAVDQDMLRIGNALNELGAAGAATGPVVADFANRIGSIGIPMGLSTGQVLGLSATLQELNVNTERGGTAVTRILQRMLTNVDEFAAVAGVSTVEFSQKLNTDLFGAFQLVVQKSQEGGDSATAFAAILDKLGVDGAGASEVFAKLGANTDLLTQKVTLAGNAIQNTDSITNEFSIKNETLGAKLDKLGKEFNKLLTSEGITNFLKGAVDATFAFIKAIERLPKFLADNSTTFITLTGVTIAYAASMAQATLASIANTTATIASNAANKALTAGKAIATAATAAYGLVTDVLTGKITLATAAQRVWNVVMSLNPIGAIIVGITALIAAFDLYKKNTAQAIELVRTQVDLSKKLDAAIKDTSAATQDFNTQIANNKSLTQQQRSELFQLIDAKYADAKATLVQLKAEQERVQSLATETTAIQELKNFLLSGGNSVAKAVRDAEDAYENGADAAAEFNDKIDQQSKLIDQLNEQRIQQSGIVNAETKADLSRAQTLDNLNEKLTLYRTALGGAVVGSEDYIRIQQKIADTQRALDAAQQKAPDASNNDDLQQRQQQLQSLADLERKLGEEKINAIKDTIEREVALADDKHAKQLEEYAVEQGDSKAHAELKNQLRLQLEETYQRDRTALVQRLLAEQAQAELAQDLANIEAGKEARIAALNDERAKGLVSEKLYQLQLGQIELEALQLRKQNTEQYGQSTLTIQKEIVDATIKIREQYNAIIDTIENDELQRKSSLIESELSIAKSGSERELQLLTSKLLSEESVKVASFQKLADAELDNLKVLLDQKLISQADYQAKVNSIDSDIATFKLNSERETADKINELKAAALQKDLAQFQDAYGQIKQIYDLFTSNLNAKENSELARDKQRNEVKKQNLKTRLDQGLITQDEYANGVANIDQQYDRKAASIKRAQFERQKIASIIEATINTAVAVSKAAANPPLAILAGVVGAVQIGIISSQKVPEFVAGGKLPGRPSNKEEDDLLVVDKLTGQPVASVQRGETIIPGDTAAANPELMQQLLDADGEPIGEEERQARAVVNLTGDEERQARAVVNLIGDEERQARAVVNINGEDERQARAVVNLLGEEERQARAVVNLTGDEEKQARAVVNFTGDEQRIDFGNTEALQQLLRRANIQFSPPAPSQVQPQLNFNRVIESARTAIQAGYQNDNQNVNTTQSQAIQTDQLTRNDLLEAIRLNNSIILENMPELIAEALANNPPVATFDYEYLERGLKRNGNSEIGKVLRKTV